MDGVLVNLSGEKHRSRRSVENKVFRRGFFQHYEKEIFPATLKAPIEEFISAGGGDLVEFGFRSLMNLTCDFAGIDRPKGTKDETDRLLSLCESLHLAQLLRTRETIEGLCANKYEMHYRTLIKSFYNHQKNTGLHLLENLKC